MDYSKLSDQQINMLVADILHPEREVIESRSRPPSACVIGHLPSKWVDYCNNPADAWPIIQSNGISLEYDGSDWMAFHIKCQSIKYSNPIKYHPNKPLRAAMILFLMMQES